MKVTAIQCKKCNARDIIKPKKNHRSGKHTLVHVSDGDIYITSTNVQLHIDPSRRASYLGLRIPHRDMIQEPATLDNGATGIIISFKLAKQIKNIIDRVSYGESN